MDWREEIGRRLTPAQEAVRAVKRGDLVVILIADPRALPNRLARLRQEDP